MKTTLTTETEQAITRLLDDSNANWTPGGARALTEYMHQIERDTGEEIEFDRVALRCGFAEYKSALEAAEDYGLDLSSENGKGEEAALKLLEKRTIVLRFDGGIIIQVF